MTVTTDGGHAFGTGPGIELSHAFFTEHVAPLADSRLGRANYAAALLGGGSDVLGLDTELSADHDWGPRVTLFVEPDAQGPAAAIDGELPDFYRGVSRRFGSAFGGTPWLHPFEVSTVAGYFDAWVGFHDAESATVLDWLARPAMSFLAVTAGAVFHDGPGRLADARRAAAWYPDDVWRWLVASQWQRIAEEHPFVGRANALGDRLGALVVTARVVRDAMHLAFLLERRYAPYSKWLGAAFRTLTVAADLQPLLTAAIDGNDFDPEDALCAAFEQLGAITNQRLGVRVEPARQQ
ncbi:MAG: DUF4037 domain-containing protein, partial [Pseudonocardiaceae bacterium]